MTVRYQIVMRSGPNPNATYALEASQTTIGRDGSNTIAINDPEISRHHARMTQQGGKIVLEDLGSTNGTSVDGNRLSAPHVLKAGETISFGEDIVFVFEAQAFDPDATVASSAASFNQVPQQPLPHAYQQPQPAAAPRQEPVYSPPQPPQPQPAQEYVGQVPADPLLATPPPASAQPRRKVLPIALAISALILLCSCGAFFWWIDATYRWCTFFPFIAGC